MEAVTLTLLKWVDAHLEALRGIELKKGHSFVVEGGIKSLEEVRGQIINAHDQDRDNLKASFVAGLRLAKYDVVFEADKWFLRSVKVIDK